jgi:hypothetical protein
MGCRGAQQVIPRGRVASIQVVLACTALSVLGCGDKRVAERMTDQLAETKGTVVPVAKFAGTVTIDGLPPSVPPPYVLALFLYDGKGKEPGHETIYHTICDKDGHFEFTRYSKGDGVPPGSYTVLFAELMHRKGARSAGTDQLKNLYNDPDKSPFHVELSPPGKNDWDFNLEVVGKDPVAAPGPHAVTRL